MEKDFTLYAFVCLCSFCPCTSIAYSRYVETHPTVCVLNGIECILLHSSHSMCTDPNSVECTLVP